MMSMSNSTDKVDKLGNYIEEEEIEKEQVNKLPVEVVKNNNKTTKKSKTEDAGLSRPKKMSMDNNSVYRDKNNGRVHNVEEQVPKQAVKDNSRRMKTELKKQDRHSRTGKIDTPKKISNSWGSDMREWQFEQDADVDAQRDRESEMNGYFWGGNEVTCFPMAMTHISLQQYIQEQEEFNRVDKVPEIDNEKNNFLSDDMKVDNEPEILNYPVNGGFYNSKHHLFKQNKQFLDLQDSGIEIPRSFRTQYKGDRKTQRGNVALKSKPFNLNELPTL